MLSLVASSAIPARYALMCDCHTQQLTMSCCMVQQLTMLLVKLLMLSITICIYVLLLLVESLFQLRDFVVSTHHFGVAVIASNLEGSTQR